MRVWQVVEQVNSTRARLETGDLCGHSAAHSALRIPLQNLGLYLSHFYDKVLTLKFSRGKHSYLERLRCTIVEIA